MKIFKILYYAYINTNNLFRSIVGYNNHNIYESEFSKKEWSFLEIIDLLSRIFLIKLPIYAPTWLNNNIKKIFFGTNSNYIQNINEIDDDGNCFIYINGILSSRNVVLSNKQVLEKIFNKPFNIIHNVTDSLLMDLIESLIGKQTTQLTEASSFALSIISKKLLDKNIKKIIIVSYSQGTIVISNVLNSLNKYGLDKYELLSKLEIYNFSNCSSYMPYIRYNLPYMEHFANENDFISKLGCNHPIEISNLINIDGKTFINKGMYGHMLNLHYLQNFKENFKESKLNLYIK